VINSALLQGRLHRRPAGRCCTRAAVSTAMTHVLLPFMVLPLYA